MSGQMREPIIIPDDMKEIKDVIQKEKQEYKHLEICKELNELYKVKNSDYGNSFSKTYETFGMTAPLIRLYDKLNRLVELNKSKEQQVKDESIRDSLIDLANYAILTIMEIDKKE